MYTAYIWHKDAGFDEKADIGCFGTAMSAAKAIGEELQHDYDQDWGDCIWSHYEKTYVDSRGNHLILDEGGNEI